MERQVARDELEELLPASDGYGPLLQRDYWAVLAGCRLAPPEIGALLAARFADFPPPELVRFRPAHDAERPLECGDVVDVDIRLAGSCQVQVVHRNDNSLTFATLAGHPEAGRITFGAYRNPVGDVVFHIRSRARSRSGTCFVGFFTAGEPMQTTTWTDFINRLAVAVGQGIVGVIRAETRKVEEADDEDAPLPTFAAAGD
jgi:hypothetical protein